MSALRRREAAAGGVAREARVSNPGPGQLTVTIDDFDGDEMARHAWPVAGWPQSATARPARGDRCLVVMSEIGRVWIVAAEWTGQALEWHDLTFKNSWAAESSSPRPGYAKSPGGWVTLRGVLAKSSPTSNQEILGDLLDDACRPPSRRSFLALSGAGVAARVHVTAAGQLETGTLPSSAPANATVVLDGIGYWTED